MSSPLWQSIQRKVGARPDGLPGDETAKSIAAALGIELAAAPAPPASRAALWPRDIREEMERFYGPPGSGHTLIDVPYPLYIDDRKLTRINVHQKIAPAVQRVLTRTLDHYGPEGIHRLQLDLYDGCYNNRPKRGGSSLSVHAYAAALDFCAAENSLHQDHTTALFAKAEYAPWWQFWEEEGALSLGRSRDFDWMHVQFARLP